jgi:hypothetical protein
MLTMAEEFQRQGLLAVGTYGILEVRDLAW